jgi:putative aldouronate transport system permease protein
MGAAPYPVRVLDALSLFGMLQYGVGYLIVTLFSVMAIALMAYPLTVRKLPGGMVYRICLLLAACVTTTISIHDYLMYQRLGMVNTIFPVLLAGFQPFISVFVLKAIFNSRYGHLKTQAEREGRGNYPLLFRYSFPKYGKRYLLLACFSLWRCGKLQCLPGFIFQIRQCNRL